MKTWCVAKPSSDQATLLDNINYACSHVDCRVLSSGCPCYSPGNLINHASIAMNLYYQANGRNYWNCNFKNSGLIVITNPSKFALTLLLLLSKTILYYLKDIRLRFQFFFSICRLWKLLLSIHMRFQFVTRKQRSMFYVYECLI